MNKIYEIKSIDNSIKDVDLKSGIVTGYFAHFNNIDKVGDIITEKAFNKTLSDNDKKLMLLNHSWTNVAGVVDVLKVDNNGLYFEKNLLKSYNVKGEQISNSVARDMLTLYAEDAISQHSIGYKTIKNEQKADANYLVELKLYEGSGLTVEAANPLTPFLGFKSCGNEFSKLENLKKQSQIINKLLKIGTLTDDLLLSLEMSFKQLEQMINDLELENEPKKDTQKEPSNHSIENEKSNQMLKNYYIKLLTQNN